MLGKPGIASILKYSVLWHVNRKERFAVEAGGYPKSKVASIEGLFNCIYYSMRLLKHDDRGIEVAMDSFERTH